MELLRLIGVVCQLMIQIGLSKWNNEIEASIARRFVTNAALVFGAIMYQMLVGILAVI